MSLGIAWGLVGDGSITAVLTNGSPNRWGMKSSERDVIVDEEKRIKRYELREDSTCDDGSVRIVRERKRYRE